MIRQPLGLLIVLVGALFAWAGIAITKLGHWVGGKVPDFDPLGLYEGDEFPIKPSGFND